MRYLAASKFCIYLSVLLILWPLAEAFSFDTPSSSSKDSLVCKTEIPFNNNTSNEGIILHIANGTTSLNKVFFKA